MSQETNLRNLLRTWRKAAGAWGPSHLCFLCYISTPPTAGDPATMWTSANQQQHIFFRDGNNNIQHIYGTRTRACIPGSTRKVS
jgi:hypothetical protein